MAELKTNLLTAQELQDIDCSGPSRWPDRTLVVSTSSQSLVFTVKGIQYYGYALAKHGFSEKLSEIQTLADLKALAHRVCSKARAEVNQELKRAYEAGTLPVHDRELAQAKLHGTLKEQLLSIDRRVRFSESGAIPVNFKKKCAAMMRR